MVCHPLYLLSGCGDHRFPLREGREYDAISPKSPKNLSPVISPLKVSESALFQIIADPFGHNSALEGEDLRKMLSLIIDYFVDRERAGSPVATNSKEICYELQQAEDILINECDESYVSSAIQLCIRVGGKLLLPGGWTGDPGHAMLYELSVNSVTKKTSLRLFNTGAGAVEHQLQTVGFKVKVSCVEWTDIDPAKLTSRVFLKNYRAIMTTKPTIPYVSRDVYHGLKSILGDPIVVLTTADSVQTQRAGTCSFYAILAFLKTKMEPNAYKKFKSDLKVQVLADHVLHAQSPRVAAFIDKPALRQRFSQPIVVGPFLFPAPLQPVHFTSPSHYRLVKEGLTRIAREVSKRYRENVVDSHYVDNSLQIFEEIRRHLNASKTIVFAKPDLTARPTYSSLELPSIAYSAVPIADSLEMSADIISQPHSSLLEEIHALGFSCPITLDYNLKRAMVKLNKAYSSNEFSVVSHGAVAVVKKLPLSPESWTDIDPMTGMENLKLIASHIILGRLKGVNREQTVSDELFAISKVLTIQMILLRRMKPFFNDKLPGFPFVNRVLRYAQFFDRATHQEVLHSSHFTLDPNRLIFSSSMNSEILLRRDVAVAKILDPEQKDSLLSLYFKIYDSTSFHEMLKKDNALVSLLGSEIDEKTNSLNFYLANTSLPAEFAVLRDTLHLFILAASPYLFQKNKIHGYRKSKKTLVPESELTPENFVKGCNPWRPTELREADIEFVCTNELKSKRDDSKGVQDVWNFRNAFYWCAGLENQNLSLLARCFCQTGFDDCNDSISEFSPTENLLRKDQLNSHNYFAITRNPPWDCWSLQVTSLFSPEYKELFHVFTTVKQKSEAVAWFNQHPRRIAEPDYQKLLMQMLFGHGRHNLAVTHNEGVILGKFLRSHLATAEISIDISTSVFLIRLNRYLAREANFIPPFSSLDKTRDLLQKRPLKPEDESLIYAEYISALGELKERDSRSRPNSEELAMLLQAIAWIGVYPVPLKYSSAQIIWEMEASRNLYFSVIKEGLLLHGQPNHTLLNKIREVVLGNAGELSCVREDVWSLVEGTSIMFRSNDEYVAIFDPIQGTLNCHYHPTTLPECITSQNSFKKIFSGTFSAIFITIGVYKVLFRGVEYFLRYSTAGELCIQKKQDAEWWQHVFHKLPPRVLASDYFDKYLCWQRLSTQELRFLHQETGEHEYSILLTESVTDLSFERLSDGAILGNPSTTFAHFEDSSYIHEWYDPVSKQLVELELPRFDLSFKPSPIDPRDLYCTQFPGWKFRDKIDGQHEVPVLGACNYALILTNDTGERKVVLPNQKIGAPQKKDVLACAFARDQSLSNGKHPSCQYFTFTLNKAGELIPDHNIQSAYLFLAKTLLAHREYEYAAKILLRFGDKLCAYTEEELEHLEQLASMEKITGDSSGNGIALSLYAATLAYNNEAEHSWVKENPQEIVSLYWKYLNLFNHVTTIKLTSEQEISLIKDFLCLSRDKREMTEEALPSNHSSMFIRRFLDLSAMTAGGEHDLNFIELLPSSNKGDGSSPPNEKIYNFFQELELKFSIVIDSENKPEVPLKPNEIPVENTSDFHQFEKLSKSFLYYLSKAIEGSPSEQEEVDVASKLLLGYDHWKPVTFGYLFQKILKDPSRFIMPPYIPPTDNQYIILREWWNDLLKRAGEVTEKVPTVLDATPNGYRLEPLKPPVPNKNILLDLCLNSRQNHINTLDKIKSMINPEELLLVENTGVRVIESNGFDPVVKKEMTDWLREKAVAEKAKSGRVLEKEWDRLQSDFAFFTEQAQVPVYELTKDVSGMISALSNGQQAELDQIESYRTRLVDMANRLPEDPLLRRKCSLERIADTAKMIVMDNILSCLAQNNSRKLKELNPSLNEQALQDLFNLAVDFLIFSTHASKRQNGLNICAEIAKTGDPDQKNRLEQELGALLHAGRAYVPKTKPAYLVFEYYAEMMMRPDQVAKLSQFLDGSHSNLILEMIMGSGKSKILMPLLGLMRADGEKMSILLVTTPLFPSVSSDTHDVLQAKFGQSLRTLPFDRQSPITLRSLEKIRETLASVIANRECLIVTARSIQSFLLKFIELNDRYYSTNDPEIRPQLDLMKQIITIFQTKGLALFDEADTAFNILHEVSFSVGKKVPPKTCHIQTIGLLYEILYTDPNFTRGKDEFTEEVYHKNIKGPLAKAFLEKLKSYSIDPETDKILKEYLENLSTVNKEHLLHYLCPDSTHVDAAQSYYNTLDPNLREVFSLASQEIHKLLPDTLAQILDQNYGVRGEPGAIPFSAVDTPNLNSIFANSFITMNYTFQAYFNEGIRRDVVESFIKNLQQLVRTGGAEALSYTEAWKMFLRLQGNSRISLMNISAEELDQLAIAINQNPLVKLYMIKNVILPQIQIFPEKISCNPISLVSLFDLPVTGFTGTLCNASSMHRKLVPVNALGTNSETIYLLWKNSREAVKKIKSGRLDDMIDQMKRLIPQADVIIDSGGYFKEGGVTRISHCLEGKLGRPVLFYNDKGEQTLTNGKSVASVDPAKRVTFLDQSHTTGADTKQANNAVGVLTIGKSMLLRDLLQGAWRLRGLRKQQKIVFLVDTEVEQIIRESLVLGRDIPLNFQNILEFVVKNQSHRQGSDAYQSFIQQLEGLRQTLLLDILLGRYEMDEAQQKMAFKLLKNSWIQETDQDCDALYGKIVLPQESFSVLSDQKKRFLDSLNVLKDIISPERIAQIQKEAGVIYRNALESVHEHISSSSVDVKGTMELELGIDMLEQKEMHTKQEFKIEKVLRGSMVNSRYFPKTSMLIKIDELDKSYLLDDQQQLVHLLPIGLFSIPLSVWGKKVQKLHDAFKGIRISSNALEIDLSGEVSCFGQTRIPFIHVQIDDYDVTILTTSEAGDHSNYTIDAGFTEGNPYQELSDQVLLKIVKIKVLNGNSVYTPRERTLLEKWIKEMGAPLFTKLLDEVCFRNQPHKRIDFNGGVVQQILEGVAALQGEK